jgi:hypothetical protein
LKRNDEKKKVEGKKTIVLYVKEDHFGFFWTKQPLQRQFFFKKIQKPKWRVFKYF